MQFDGRDNNKSANGVGSLAFDDSEHDFVQRRDEEQQLKAYLMSIRLGAAGHELVIQTCAGRLEKYPRPLGEIAKIARAR